MKQESHKVLGCALCQRRVPLTFHHLIPKKMHRRCRFQKDFGKQELAQGIWVCRLCHNGIHKLHDEMTLAKDFNTLAKLKADAALQKHVDWAAKQKRSSAP